jgi:hypothetical protein
MFRASAPKRHVDTWRLNGYFRTSQMSHRLIRRHFASLPLPSSILASSTHQFHGRIHIGIRTGMYLS